MGSCMSEEQVNEDEQTQIFKEIPRPRKDDDNDAMFYQKKMDKEVELRVSENIKYQMADTVAKQETQGVVLAITY
eukprot:CAMPEP_0116886164 /NCGR_PEP_ID=MMETSP0463-20121206/19857_1 /TAXON_ID=181622 /ORGANISM="Strombidinopsis sp, Strain SopsisLIS2011" /LENGTH=74 /DNA_ID=CAMNT_0004545997 /DNA_START=18 /DNA_END=242 /DNA_ORIENTATION=-